MTIEKANSPVELLVLGIGVEDNVGPAPGAFVVHATAPLFEQCQKHIEQAIGQYTLSDARTQAWGFVAATEQFDACAANEEEADPADVEVLELRGCPTGPGAVTLDIVCIVNEAFAWSKETPRDVATEPAVVLEGNGISISIGACAHKDILDSGIEDIAGPEVVGVIVAALRRSGWGNAIADRLEAEGVVLRSGPSARNLSPA